MIELVRARNGAEVLKMDGRLLASIYDPMREGEGWAKRAAEALPEGAGVLALGLGSAYGVAALQALIGPERLAVLEPSGDVVERARELAARSDSAAMRKFDFARVASGQRPEDALAREAAREIWRGRFRIATTGAAIEGDVEWHRRAQALLIAREPWAFRQALAMRPGVRAAFDRAGLEAELAEMTGLVSINVISRHLRADAGGRDAMIWRALEELVA